MFEWVTLNVCLIVFDADNIFTGFVDACVFLCRYIENWTSLEMLRDVDMELYPGLQRL